MDAEAQQLEYIKTNRRETLVLALLERNKAVSADSIIEDAKKLMAFIVDDKPAA